MGSEMCIRDRPNNPHEYRVTERLCERNPFPFARVGDNGSVGGQTIVGIPHILALLESNEGRSVFAWPFDGVDLPADVRHVLAEVYPTAMRSPGVPQSDLNDAIACVDWCMKKDAEGSLRQALSLNAFRDFEVETIKREGWYLK